jgi:hypothetical protein
MANDDMDVQENSPKEFIIDSILRRIHVLVLVLSLNLIYAGVFFTVRFLFCMRIMPLTWDALYLLALFIPSLTIIPYTCIARTKWGTSLRVTTTGITFLNRSIEIHALAWRTITSLKCDKTTMFVYYSNPCGECFKIIGREGFSSGKWKKLWNCIQSNAGKSNEANMTDCTAV